MFRKVLVGVVSHGRKVFEGIIQKAEVAIKNGKKPQEAIQSEVVQSSRYVPKRPIIFRIGEANKGYLSQQVARYARKNLASELRNQFNKSPIYREYSGLARRLSMFAFVGVGFASYGNKQEESYSSVCNHIQNLLQSKLPSEDDNLDPKDHGLQNFDLGPIIAKGCNAAVYKARYICDAVETQSSCSDGSDVELIDEDSVEGFEFVKKTLDNEIMRCDDAVLEYDLCESDQSSDVEVIEEDEQETGILSNFKFSCQGQHTPGIPALDTGQSTKNNNISHDDEFDLAIKMMFNYDTKSNADAILREMRRELIPSKTCNVTGLLGTWDNGHRAKEKSRLPPHPNIVEMSGAFVDDMPCLPEGPQLYPDALPPKYNPEGSGRNKTLFLVMKRYSMTLREYLESHPMLPTGQSVLLLAQLLEAVAHLNTHEIAHRDLKSDNIFVELVDGSCPRLVVSDFGDCMNVGQHGSLLLPYYTDEISKGGNGALMAPEIATAYPGPGEVLDYSKSDLWTVGTLAYEIFGVNNPFYRTPQGVRLSSRSYLENQLPKLPADVPVGVRNLISMMLFRDPQQRPTATQAATMLQTMLWSPVEWSLTLAQRSRSLPSSTGVMRWLLTLTAQVLIERGCCTNSPAAELRRRFLIRVNFEELMSSIESMSA